MINQNKKKENFSLLIYTPLIITIVFKIQLIKKEEFTQEILKRLEISNF